MAVNSSRSLNGSLHAGMAEGMYRLVRPDTEVIPGMSNVDMRRHLYSWHYDLIDQQIEQGERELPDGTLC